MAIFWEPLGLESLNLGTKWHRLLKKSNGIFKINMWQNIKIN